MKQYILLCQIVRYPSISKTIQQAPILGMILANCLITIYFKENNV